MKNISACKPKTKIKQSKKSFPSLGLRFIFISVAKIIKGKAIFPTKSETAGLIETDKKPKWIKSFIVIIVTKYGAEDRRTSNIISPV